MTDGNTAIQVSPVLSEGEMKSFQDLFTKIANTITQASSLAGEFENIKVQVSGLTHDLEYQRSRNSTLDEAISHIRSERDEANRLLSEGRTEWSALKNDLANAQGEIETGRIALTNACNELNTCRTERDEAMFKVLELTEELDKAKASLASIHKALGITPKTEEPQAIPVPQDTPVVDYSHNPMGGEPERVDPVFTGQGEGFKEAPQADATERKRILEGEPGWSSETWYDAQDKEYGTDSATGKRWHYADAKHSA